MGTGTENGIEGRSRFGNPTYFIANLVNAFFSFGRSGARIFGKEKNKPIQKHGQY